MLNRYNYNLSFIGSYIKGCVYNRVLCIIVLHLSVYSRWKYYWCPQMRNNYGACLIIHRNIGLSSTDPCRVIALNLLCLIFAIIYLLLFFIFPMVIAPTIATTIVGRTITKQKAIQKRSHESMCKTDTKMGSNREKFKIVFAKLEGW